MGIESQEEGNEQMVGIPERLVGLLPYLGMSGRKHEEHAEEHDMTCDTARLSVVYLNCRLLSDLTPFNIEKATEISSAQYICQETYFT